MEVQVTPISLNLLITVFGSLVTALGILIVALLRLNLNCQRETKSCVEDLAERKAEQRDFENCQKKHDKLALEMFTQIQGHAHAESGVIPHPKT